MSSNVARNTPGKVKAHPSFGASCRGPPGIRIPPAGEVRFENPERQRCSICLEQFGHGMLLTGLGADRTL